MRLLVLTLALVAAACSSGDSATTAPTTTPVTLPTTTTSTTVAGSTTSSPTTAPSTTTTSFVVPPATCAIDLPVSDSDEVSDVELAAFSVGASSTQLWTIDLGDRPVEMDTLGDRVYVAAFDGLVASFDVDPCGLDWVATVPPAVTDVVATSQGVFVVSRSALSLVELIEGTVTSFPLEEGVHTAVAGPDVAAVSNGTGVLLYDYITQQASPLDVGARVEALADADGKGLLVGHGITVELRTWLGAPVWARDMPDAVAAVTATDGLVLAELTTGNVIALDAATGTVIWDKVFAPGSSVQAGPVDHGEAHVLEVELGVVARHHHLNTGDGSTVFVNESPALQTFAEYDDELLLVVDSGVVTGRSLLEQDLWTIATGADGLGRFTEVDLTSGLVIALSYSAERF